MEDIKKEHPEGCKCGMCTGSGMKCGGMCGGRCGGCGCGGRHVILRIILGIIIVVAVFWMGFKLGVIVGSLNGGYGSQMSSGRHMMRNAYPVGMMGGWSANQQAPSAPATK